MSQTVDPRPPRVVVYGHGYDDYSRELAVLAPSGVTRIEEARPGRDLETLREADALLVRETPVPASLIEQLDRCRAIVRYGIGVDSVDLEAARARRIYVANVPTYGMDEVATHALALFLTVLRGTARRDRAVRSGRWDTRGIGPVPRLRGLTLGVVGFGNIGEELHRKAHGMGFGRTLAFDPYRRTWPQDVEPAALDDVFREADFVSLHAPLTEETRHLADARRLGLMKPTAVLVNTARGGLVDEGALVAALEEGRLLGAGLDVFEHEPLDASHPLTRSDRAVLTDHTAWSSAAALEDLQRGAAEEVRRVLSGEKPKSWVNPWPA